MRFGLGPVFAYERLAQARRWQTYAARSLMVAALLFAMTIIASSRTGRSPGNAAQGYAELGESYFYALIGVELALVLVAAPAATAGAICLDRARGNLAHVMATDLSDSEIVLGKLAARLFPVMGLVVCTWPVMAISTLLGGIDPIALALGFAIIVTVALLGCAIALALSVWAKKSHEVILTTYAVWLVVLMIWPVWFVLSLGKVLRPPGHWTLVIDPFYLAFAPYSDPGRVDFRDYALFFTTAIVGSGTLVSLAVRRMRPVTIRQASEAGKAPRLGLIGRMARWLPGPSLEDNPVLWREWHRSRPSLWMTILVAILGGTTGLGCCIGAFVVWRDGVVAFGPAGPGQVGGIFAYLIQLSLGLLMLAVLAPLSLSEERQRGSLDVLTATPLSTRAIVLGKWWGTFRLVPMLAIGPGLMAFALATAERPAPPPAWAARTQSAGPNELICGAALFAVTILAHGAAITSLGLALATWMKRQVRAVSTSVGVFVLVAIGWPFFATNIGRDSIHSSGLSSLSPLYSAIETADELTMRLSRITETIWWMGFWDVGVVAFAIGLLWLTGRTFDVALGRIPESPRTSPVLADVIAALGGTTAASCLYLAVTVWVEGAFAHSLNSDGQDRVLCFILLVMLGLLSLSVAASLSISANRRREGDDTLITPPRSPRSIVLTEWWRLVRLLALLAFGPGLIAVALATAPTISIAQPTLPVGTVVVRAPRPPAGPLAAPVLPSQAPTLKTVVLWEIPRGERLWTAATLVMLILALGALTIGTGLASGTWIKRASWAVAVSIGLFLPIALVGSVLGMAQLFTQLVTREPQLAGLGGWPAMLLTIILIILMASFALWIAIRGLDRPSRPRYQAGVLGEPVPS